MKNKMILQIWFDRNWVDNLNEFLSVVQSEKLDLNKSYIIGVYAIPIDFTPSNLVPLVDLVQGELELENLYLIKDCKFCYDGSLRVFIDLYYSVIIPIVKSENDGYYLGVDGEVCHNLFVMIIQKVVE